jgi:hypothetical protein
VTAGGYPVEATTVNVPELLFAGVPVKTPRRLSERLEGRFDEE